MRQQILLLSCSYSLQWTASTCKTFPYYWYHHSPSENSHFYTASPHLPVLPPSDCWHLRFSCVQGTQGHVLLTAHSLLQDLPHGTHFLFTSEPLILMIRFVASLKLTYFLYLVDLCDIVYVACIVCTVLFVRRCWALVEWRHSKLFWWWWWWWVAIADFVHLTDVCVPADAVSTTSLSTARYHAGEHPPFHHTQFLV